MSLIISSYLIPLTGLLFLLVLIKINPLFNKKQTTFFLIAVIINIVLITATSLDYIFAELNYPYFWAFRRITSFMNFAASPLVPLMLLKIFDQKKSKIYLYLPCIFNMVVCFASIFVKIVFFISENNKYGRGPLFLLPFMTTLFYIGILIIKPNNYHLQSKKKERLFLFSIIVLLGLSMVLEIQLKFKFLNWGCSALGLILYYLFLNIHCFILDPLTGVYNRLMYNRALTAIEGKSTCTMALIDINHFKEINDTYGHDEGDQVLMRFTAMINNDLDKIAVLYRIGGDEFVLICKKTDAQTFESALEAAHKKISGENISFAYGTISYTPDDNLQDALKKMDENMYENKNRMKKETGVQTQ